MDVRAEGDFLSVEHTHLTTEEFIGNPYRLEYFITMDKLHKGSNFGQIILETPYETLNYEVVVEKDISRDEEYRENDREFAGILKSFLQYEEAEWIWILDRRCTSQNFASAGAGCNNEFYLLAHAHICLLGQRMEEAKWLLDRTIITVLQIGKDVELSSYYLYLTTLLSNDSIGQRRVAEELSRSFMKHPQAGRFCVCWWK